MVLLTPTHPQGTLQQVGNPSGPAAKTAPDGDAATEVTPFRAIILSVRAGLDVCPIVIVQRTFLHGSGVTHNTLFAE